MITYVINLINQYQFFANVAFGAVGGLVSGWLFTKYKINKQLEANIKEFELKIEKQHSTNISEEKLKKELERNNQLLYTTLNHYSGFRKGFNEKQLNAIGVVWKAFIELRDTIPSTLTLYLSALKKDEFNYNNIRQSKMFDALQTQIGTLDLDYQHSSKITEISKPVELLRYAISKDLYDLWRAYLAVTGRVVMQFSRGLQSKNISPWQDDEGINQQLKATLTQEEVDHIYSRIFGGFDVALELLRRKAISIITSTITGKEESSNLLEQIEIFEQQQMKSGELESL